jgi:hypothetical protein
MAAMDSLPLLTKNQKLKTENRISGFLPVSHLK